MITKVMIKYLVVTQITLASQASAGMDTAFRDYAATALLPSFQVENNLSMVVAISGEPPFPDRQSIAQTLTVFSWATETEVSLVRGDQGRLVFVYEPNFADLRITQHPGTVNGIVSRNLETIKRGGPCSKITSNPGSPIQVGYVFMSAQQTPIERKNCIYSHVRSLFGVSELGMRESFSKTFVYDLRLARCIYDSYRTKRPRVDLLTNDAC